jgi:vacuolar-type H+-ATPase subunit C/Vma6
VYEYGNARVAACRSRLLGADDLRRLREAGSAPATLAVLARFDDWHAIVAEVAALASPPAAAIHAAIEAYRSRRLAALLGWYPPPIRKLVEALVMPLDVERLLAIVRRRRAGQSSDLVGASVAPGALLDAGAIGRLARATTLEALIERAADEGLLAPSDASAVADLATSGGAADRVEQAIVAATDRARLARASGRHGGAALVRRVMDDEVAVRIASVVGTREAGPAVAALGERDATLARLDGLARLGRRDPLGIGVVAGYAAAVEATAIRLRAVVAGAVAGWSPGLVGEYLDVGPRPSSPSVSSR